ncbi:PAS sensor-containing signal transduction protein [Arcobacter venerupis]|uniref:PAS sensor-containing signal transduction protein n=1 Tax=Arcobacter venerupis TaxID=1054033 RepID=A0AAE7E302_9BACT|nr:PAS domain-containing protein [Arcobacter venerupis]QKF65799.1 PAS sensor-containing signal transduction protein [Arcobacter venerupis]RWS50306.1 PAS sensor domain-containing protein [Arcobacter venerupis]
MEQEIKMPEKMIIVTETDAKGIIKFANDDFCKIAGYSLDELIEQPHSKVRHPDMPKAAFVDLWQTIQKGEIWKGIVKNKTKENAYYWVNATVYSSKTSSGELRYISVRVKPTTQEIANAIKLYSTFK